MPRRKLNKEHLHLYIDRDVLERAKELIPNLSFFVELKLREYLALIENPCGGWDSNPRTPSGADPKSAAFVHSATPALGYY